MNSRHTIFIEPQSGLNNRFVGHNMVLRVHTIHYTGASVFALFEVAGFAGVGGLNNRFVCHSMVLRVHTIHYTGASVLALLEVAGFAGVAFVFLGGAPALCRLHTTVLTLNQ